MNKTLAVAVATAAIGGALSMAAPAMADQQPAMSGPGGSAMGSSDLGGMLGGMFGQTNPAGQQQSGEQPSQQSGTAQQLPNGTMNPQSNESPASSLLGRSLLPS